MLRFIRAAAAPAGCDTANPAETSDIWIFDTLASSEVRVHCRASMPYPDPPVPAAAGGRRRRQVHHAARWTRRDSCQVASISTMTDGSGASLLSYALSDLESLGGAAYQNAEFKANVTYTAGPCTADYTGAGALAGGGLRERRRLRSVQAAVQLGHLQRLRPGLQDDPWTVPVAHFLGASGVCFFNQPYPSLK